MISATITGHLGRDAELRHVEGATVVSFSLASRRYQSGGEHTDWLQVSFWGRRAESICNHLVKGKTVAVRGSLWVRTYDRDGETRWSLECRADDVELLGGGDRDDRRSDERDPQRRRDERRSHGNQQHRNDERTQNRGNARESNRSTQSRPNDRGGAPRTNGAEPPPQHRDAAAEDFGDMPPADDIPF